MIARRSLDDAFAAAKREGRPALIAYVVAGDPDLATTRLVIDAIVDAGVDMIELGIPYGDPLADGPTIAAAAHRALQRGVRIDDVLGLVPATRVPTVLFTYANPIVQYGLDRFAAAAAAAGAAGAIVPDIPLEETGAIRASLESHGMELPLLIAPTTPPERAGRIVSASRGFVYLVSRLGVTGANVSLDTGAIRAQLASLRAHGSARLAVGFGISRPEHVRAIRDAADGIIIGSALIDAFSGQTGASAAAAAAAFIAPLRSALRA